MFSVNLSIGKESDKVRKWDILQGTLSRLQIIIITNDNNTNKDMVPRHDNPL